MDTLREVYKYTDTLPIQLDAAELMKQARVPMYVTFNRIIETIDTANPRYRTISDLYKETTEVINEMRNDILRVFKTCGCLELEMMEGIPVNEALNDLDLMDIKDSIGCVNYLTDLAIIAYYTTRFNELDGAKKLLLDTVIYVALIALELLEDVSRSAGIGRGMSINFARRKERGRRRTEEGR